jgi:hypothetical protein
MRELLWISKLDLELWILVIQILEHVAKKRVETGWSEGDTEVLIQGSEKPVI